MTKEVIQQEADKGVFSMFNACMYKEQCRAAIAQPKQPARPICVAYGVKSKYGFDPVNKHKQLIGISIGRPGTVFDEQIVELFTADQMREYALAAIAAAQAAQPTDADRLDWLETIKEAYGFENEHLGNKWVLEGPFRNARAAIDAAITASKG